jgi:excisionase family DNA binding protein
VHCQNALLVYYYITKQIVLDVMMMMIHSHHMQIDYILSLPHASLADVGSIPAAKGVYFVMSRQDAPLYVGSSVNLGRRVAEHVNFGRWKSDEATIYWLLAEDHQTIEAEAIAALSPRDNRAGVAETFVFDCYRCGHRWNPRSVGAVQTPQQCPHCKSPKWHQKRLDLVPIVSSSGPLLSIKKVAERLRVSPRLVSKLIDSHQLEYLKIGRRTLIESAEVERYIESLRSESK